MRGGFIYLVVRPEKLATAVASHIRPPHKIYSGFPGFPIYFRIFELNAVGGGIGVSAVSFVNELGNVNVQ